MATATPAPTAGAKPKIKVAILGGGPAGLSTAFWLTSTPAWRDRYDVSVYTPGWRIGGKCASGREDGRILEHGLHILMGCYRNVFATMCACYDEWKPAPGTPFKTWSDAVTPQCQVTLPEKNVFGRWRFWNFNLPSNNQAPCDAALAAAAPPPMTELLKALSRRVERQMLAHDPKQGGEVRKSMDDFRDLVDRSGLGPQDTARVVQQLQRLQQQVQPLRDDVADAAVPADATLAGADIPLSAWPILLNLGLAIMVGIARAEAEKDGFARLDEIDFRAWLKANGAWEMSLRSAPIRALYDLTFAFPEGDGSDITKGSIAAGVTLRFALEAALAYVGAPLWKMNAGTGDTLFTPLYQVLVERGVKFNFFHRVEEIALANGRIEQITLLRQATTTRADYQPFVTVNGLACWPSRPLWDQLVGGDKLEEAGVDFESPGNGTGVRQPPLQAGTDFDIAVLATPPDIIRDIARNLATADKAWNDMLTHSSSVGTAAFQLWLKPPLQDLGWELGSTVLTAYEAPFGSWADMSHLIPREPAGATKTIAYFCGCIPDGQVPLAEVGMAAWLLKHIGVLWPDATSVVDGNGEGNPDLLEHVYERQNLAGSERYVLTPPKSVKYRLSPSKPVFDNLYVAGDWTATRFSGGCVESAFESGVLAAKAIQRDLP